jgi:hypothetical protein
VSTLVICGRGGEIDTDGLGVGDGEAVGDAVAEAVGDAVVEAVGDAVWDADADGGLAVPAVADGESPRPAEVAGEVTVTTAGRIFGTGSGAGEAGATGVPDPADCEGRVAVAAGAKCAADECGGRPGVRLNTTDAATIDAATTPAAIPAAVIGRHQRRGERAWPGEAAVTTTGFGGVYWANARRGQPAAGRSAPASASTWSAVGRSRGSLARQRSTSGRNWAGSPPRLGGL